MSVVLVFCVTFGHVLAACTAKGRSVPLFARPEFGFGSPSELLKWIADPADRRLKNLVLDRHHMGAEQHQQQSVPKRSGGAWPWSSRVKSCTMSIAPLFPRLLVCLFVRLLTARDERLLGSQVAVARQPVCPLSWRSNTKSSRTMSVSTVPRWVVDHCGLRGETVWRPSGNIRNEKR